MFFIFIEKIFEYLLCSIRTKKINRLYIPNMLDGNKWNGEKLHRECKLKVLLGELAVKSDLFGCQRRHFSGY